MISFRCCGEIKLASFYTEIDLTLIPNILSIAFILKFTNYLTSVDILLDMVIDGCIK